MQLAWWVQVSKGVAITSNFFPARKSRQLKMKGGKKTRPKKEQISKGVTIIKGGINRSNFFEANLDRGKFLELELFRTYVKY